MAVITDIPGLKVEVKVDGQPLDEFPSPDEPDTENTTTRYIEASSGANFTVFIALDQALVPYYKDWDLYTALFLDGHKCYSHTIKRSSWILLGSEQFTVSEIANVENGEWCWRRMAFSELTIVDNDGVTRSPAEIKTFQALGEIKFTIQRCLVEKNPNPTSSKPSNFRDFNAVDSVPEHKLKGRALSHQVKLGGVERRKRCSTRKHTTRRTEIDVEPFATFVFRYRSKHALIAEGIISRPSSPVPLEDRAIDALSKEEAHELIRRLQTQQQGGLIKREVKRELEDGFRQNEGNTGGAGGDDSDVEIITVRPSKRQRTSEPDRRASSPNCIEVLDLCDD